MSIRKIIAHVVGATGCVAVGWAVHGLLLIGTCGDFGQPACPPQAPGYLGALFGGVVAVVGAVIAGAGLALPGLFLALTVAALRAAAELPPAERTTPFLLAGIFGLLILVPLALLPFVLHRRRAATRLAAEGDEAIGTITRVQDTGVTINDDPRVRLTLHISPSDGSPSFTGETALVVSRLGAPSRGQRFAVRYDPADRRRFVLGDPLDVADVGDADPLDRLAKLHQLRLAGALTDEEFAAQKRRILADLP
ncbi:Short C-terminal domain-containing protein [Micromonospora citrea]|uniref:Short C-terminal domain-containing protein n=1 Tax=Micromonospora citrea TaxID=47855 RepID=A0A1C6TRV2_9ACTN|nr:SHOCT domain-containing protein [Micromonospora citrea]SCL44399.1 Short C-terminal domain-containing protein [Micromonospora citrea]